MQWKLEATLGYVSLCLKIKKKKGRKKEASKKCPKFTGREN